jgi:phosphoglycerate dehydrogenase-like enzyme
VANERPKVLLACSQRLRDTYLPPAEIARLETFADWKWFAGEGGGIYHTNSNPEDSARLRAEIGGCDALVMSDGCPTIDAAVLAAAPRLRLIGELEGDRFASRIDLDAAWQRDIRIVDVTNASSYPVSEWALGLILVCLRNAGAFFRNTIVGKTARDPAEVARIKGRLERKRVGLIGCGHMGRRLLKLLRPFETEIWVHDPYLPREMAEALGFLQTSLDNVLSQCDVVVCLVPLTPKTRNMLSTREFDLLRPGTVFVNVSRGQVADSAALVARAKRGDIFVGLDVFDPEPVPPESEIIKLPNAFLSPHLGARTGDPHPHFFKLMVDELDRFFHGHETWFDLTPRAQANRLGK